MENMSINLRYLHKLFYQAFQSMYCWISGSLGIVAIFYQVKQKQKQTLQPDLTPKRLCNAPPNHVKSKSSNNNNKKSNDISQRNPAPYSLRIPIRGFCLEDTFRVPVAADFPVFELDGTIAGAGADGASTGGLLTALLTVTWLIVLLQVLGWIVLLVLTTCSFAPVAVIVMEEVLVFVVLGFSFPSSLVRQCRFVGGDASSKIPTLTLLALISSRIRPEALVPLLRTESLGDFRCGGEDDESYSCSCSSSGIPWFAAMFFSDAVSISSSSVSADVLADADIVNGSCSMGIVRTERGRLPWAFFLGLGGANLTGEGERDGSFSLAEMLFSSSFSSFSSFSFSS